MGFSSIRCPLLLSRALVPVLAFLVALPGGAVLLELLRLAAGVRPWLAAEPVLASICALAIGFGMFSPRLSIRGLSWAIAMIGYGALANALTPNASIERQLAWLVLAAPVGLVAGIVTHRTERRRHRQGGSVVAETGKPRGRGIPISRPVLLIWGTAVALAAVFYVHDGLRVASQARIASMVVRGNGRVVYSDPTTPTVVVSWLDRLPRSDAHRCLYSVRLGPAASDTDLYELVASGMGNLPDLEILELQASGVTDEGLSALRPFANLHKLNLGPRITDSGLSRVQGLGSLRRLGLQCTKVGGEGLRSVQELPNLVQLDLSGTPIRDETVPCLKMLPRLQFLNLSRTEITDASLSDIKDLPNLNCLMVMDTHIGDGGLRFLRTAPRLRWLFVQGTHVTSAGLRELQGANPNLWMDLH